MRTLVVGGHTRNIGKTSLGVDLIRAFPEARWTAVKITQYGHGVCSVNGAECSCALDEHTVSLDEELDRNNRTDSSRFLVAGAARAFWLRTKQGRLAEALPQLRVLLAGEGNALLESNTVLHFLKPDLYIVVLDPAQPDFKESARAFLDRADAVVFRSAPEPAAWPSVSPSLVEGKPAFAQKLGEALPAELIDFVRRRFLRSTTVSR
jgi:hypothetical protein